MTLKIAIGPIQNPIYRQQKRPLTTRTNTTPSKAPMPWVLVREWPQFRKLDRDGWMNFWPSRGLRRKEPIRPRPYEADGFECFGVGRWKSNGKNTYGNVTFHRAVNYGAVLQAYALQKSVEKLGINAISWLPKQKTWRRIPRTLSSKCRTPKEFAKFFLRPNTKQPKNKKFQLFGNPSFTEPPCSTLESIETGRWIRQFYRWQRSGLEL